MKKKIIPFLIIACFLLIKRPALATDPHLFLDPITGSYSDNFDIEVKIDTGGQAIGGADVYLNFPNEILKIENVIQGDALPEVYPLIQNNEGKLRLSAYFSASQASESYTGGDGLLATITFSILTSGPAEISFICNSGATNDSNIARKSDSQDIIVCQGNVDANLTAAGGIGSVDNTTPTPETTTSPIDTGNVGTGTLTSTPTPVTSSGNSTTPTTGTLTPTTPVSGSFTETISFLGIGLLIILTGLVLAL